MFAHTASISPSSLPWQSVKAPLPVAAAVPPARRR